LCGFEEICLYLGLNRDFFKMSNLRRVIIKYGPRFNDKGYFHRYVYMSNRDETVTKALIELDSGDLELIELRSVKFLDRPER
jgi:hypothetical protein